MNFVIATIFVLPIIAAQCPSDYEPYGAGDTCVKLFPSSLSYYEAMATCRRNGGFLTSIHNVFENQRIFDLGRRTMQPVWIGLRFHDLNMLSWDDGTDVNYSKWARGYPAVSAREETCTSMNTHFGMDATKWQNLDRCLAQRPFICEISAEMATTQQQLMSENEETTASGETETMTSTEQTESVTGTTTEEEQTESTASEDTTVAATDEEGTETAAVSEGSSEMSTSPQQSTSEVEATTTEEETTTITTIEPTTAKPSCTADVIFNVDWSDAVKDGKDRKGQLEAVLRIASYWTSYDMLLGIGGTGSGMGDFNYELSVHSIFETNVRSVEGQALCFGDPCQLETTTNQLKEWYDSGDESNRPLAFVIFSAISDSEDVRKTAESRWWESWTSRSDVRVFMVGFENAADLSAASYNSTSTYHIRNLDSDPAEIVTLKDAVERAICNR